MSGLQAPHGRPERTARSVIKPFKEEIHQTVRKLYVSILVREVTTQKILQQLQIMMFKKWLKIGSQRLKKCTFTFHTL